MFYVSRRVGATKYGVVDTDDNHEDVMDKAEIKNAVCKLGVQILGVTTKIGKSNLLTIDRIEVYVPPAVRTKQESKLLMLKKIDIKSSGGKILSLDWNPLPNSPNRVIRLSDYGTSCGPTILPQRYVKEGYPHHVADQNITLILDDKITIERKTFKGCYATGLVFDLREVTNKQTVEWFYAELGVDIALDNVRPTVLDKPERIDAFLGFYIFEVGHYSMIQQYCHDAVKIEKMITAKYLPMFKKLPDKFDYKIKDSPWFEEFLLEYAKWYTIHRDNVIMTDFFQTWERMIHLCFGKHCLMSCIQWYFNGGTSIAFTRLVRYVQLANPDKAAKDAYVEIYNRISAILIECCRRKGLVS